MLTTKRAQISAPINHKLNSPLSQRLNPPLSQTFISSLSRARLQKREQSGFTLIEVLVALAIFGIVSLTLLTQTREQTRQASGMEDRLLAHWVALNAITDLQTSPDFPELGKTENSAVLAGRDWFIQIQTVATPIASVRHIDVSVAAFEPVSGRKGSYLVSEVGFVRQRPPVAQQ